MARSSLLHVEIANDNTPNMPLRMLRYYTDIRLAGQRGPIRQFLIYIGSERLTMPDGLEEPGLLDYHYGLVDMHRINCAGLLAQDKPDALCWPSCATSATGIRGKWSPTSCAGCKSCWARTNGDSVST